MRGRRKMSKEDGREKGEHREGKGKVER